ncbi:energy transducer TonB [Flavobacterium sp. GCM10023249]|uniref:energy transducer TonB n=1 Tax=unclassified Flavobacterium TaxID=196869 RepID=UPI00360A4E1C
MRKTLYILLLLNNILLAQGKKDKKIYLDSLKRETKETGHHFYRIIKDYRLDQKEYQVLTCYKSGKLEEEKTIAYKEDHQGSIGIIKRFYENGNPKHLYTPYGLNDSIQSRTIEYYETGIKETELLATHKGRKATLYKYYPNGNKEETIAIDYDSNIPQFRSKTLEFWDENGIQTVANGNGYYSYNNEHKTIKGQLKEGNKVNQWITFDKETGTTNTINYNETGYFVNGEIKLKDGETTTYNKYETQPSPKKGLQDFTQHISKNFNFTREAIQNKVKGRIILEFIVEKDGKITEVKVIRGLGYGLDEEAIRVVSNYEDWIPGQQFGQNVRAHFSVPIAVNLN